MNDYITINVYFYRTLVYIEKETMYGISANYYFKSIYSLNALNKTHNLTESYI